MHHREITRLFLVALTLAFAAGARPVAAETVSLEWDPNPEAEVVGYRVFIGSQAGVYDSQVDVGNVTRYQLGTPEAGRRYCFAVAAYAAGPVLGSKSVEVCTDTNQPPTLQNPGSQAGQVGVAVALQLVGADPESSPVTYSATGQPTGLTINANTGFLSGTPTTVGTFNVQATISDGTLGTTQAFTWTIGAAGLPGVTTLLRPTGTIVSNTPTFEWESLATATSYRLWVDDASATNPKIQIDYTAAQAGCSTAGAVCQANPGIALAVGSASWSIQVSNASGAGPWSGAMDFMVPDTKAPVVAITLPTANPTFSTTSSTFALVGTASDNQAVTQVTWTNNRGGSGTASGTTSWGINEFPLFSGINILTVTARDAAGNAGTDVLTVTRTDSVAPTVKIAVPTAGNTTSQTAMNLTGTASDDVAVTAVTWANDRGGSGTAAGTTNWSVSNILLSSGANVITVTAVDAAGNRSTDTLRVVVDKTAPAVSITAPTTAATLVIGAATLALGGTASDDTAVTQVTWATDTGASGVAAGTTSWSVPGVPLTAAVTVVTVTASDAAGNSSTDVLTVTRPDTTAPTVDIMVPSALATLSTTFETIALGGTAADNVGVTQVTWSNSQGGSGTVAGTTSWSVAGVALKPGANVITVTARDAAGNVATDSLTVTLTDITAPVVTITAPTTAGTHSTNAASIALAGAASDLFGVTEVRWANNRGGGGVATGTTGWSVPAAALQLGANVITVTARDAAGNTATASITVASDRTAPVVAITAPTKTGSFLTTNDTVTLDGTASDNVGVTELTWVNSRGGSGQVPGAASWRAQVPVVAGVSVITVTARDAAGNLTSATISVTRDSQAPSIAIVAPDASGPVWTSVVYVALRGTASDDSGVTRVTWQTNTGYGVATGTSDWTIPSVGLHTGGNVITVTAYDAAGNATSASRTFMLDRTPPVVSITAPTATGKLVTTENEIAVGGTATDAGEVAEVSWTNSQGGGGVASGTAQWSILRVSLRPGPNLLTITARDKAGNVGTRILGVSVTDVQAPSVRIVTPASGQEHSTAIGAIDLQGTALDDFGPARVTWVNDRGGSGVADGDTAWTVAGLALRPGVNVITVIAQDPAGNTSTDRVRVTFDSGVQTIALASPNTAVASKSAAAAKVAPTNSSPTTSLTSSVTPTDSTAPVVKIFAPTTAKTFATGEATLTIGGTATDTAGVTEVFWTNSRGGGGVAFGTSGWGVPGIPLAPGVNIISVTARDAAGNNGAAVLTVTSTPQTTSQLSLNSGTAQATR